MATFNGRPIRGKLLTRRFRIYIDLTAETIENAFDHVIDKLIELRGDNNAEN
jgi:hypothetical protein